jgi:NitT/TauT family transport system substrate-binding protein
LRNNGITHVVKRRFENQGRVAMLVQSRRRFLTNAALAGAAGLGGFGARGRALAAEPPPEITTIRFEKDAAACIAPQAFQELLRAEGFTDIRYVDLTEAHLRRADAAKSGFVADMIAHGEADFGREFAPSQVLGMNAGAPITILSGLHLGCFEVFGKSEIRTLADLKGGTVGANLYSDRALLTIMTALVGLDPAKDLRWVITDDPSRQPIDLFTEGKIDAFAAGSTGSAGSSSSRQEHRTCNRQQHHRPSMVAILLLHAGRQH